MTMTVVFTDLVHSSVECSLENCARDVKKVILCLVTIFTGVGEFKCMMLVSVVTW